MKRKTWLLIVLLPVILRAQGQSVDYTSENLHFEWNLAKDRGTVKSLSSGNLIWSGSLLPAWWLKINGQQRLVKASLISLSPTGSRQWKARLKLGGLGQGELMILLDKQGLRFEQLTINWNGPQVPAIIAMYFGITAVDLASSAVSPGWDKPFVPDWQSTGFCVPGAKEGPAQSYFRSWDFGQSNIALGSFGPSLGSPYAAAYPRPVLFAGMGSNEGLIVLGAGSIPDAPMSLRLLGARGCFEYVYREDIWGSSASRQRTWAEPLRLCIDVNAWAAFDRYGSSFPVTGTQSAYGLLPLWNTWGTWASKSYVIKPITAMAKQTGAGLMVMDGSWEASLGGARPNQKRFPGFSADLDSVRSKEMVVGVWQSVGWVDDPYAEGLTNADLLLNVYGKPCKANWNFDPFGESHYCLDPSSEKARQFLVKRTERLMNTLHPRLLKLDFGYGLPSPATAVPRNPDYRGEKYAYALVKLIHDAAKRVDPDVAVMYYSISPLWTSLEDVVSLDDQGDLWYGIKEGHASWSIWASLLGKRNTAISGSSGYDWEQDEEAVLNTCILGVPGSVLPVTRKNNEPVSPQWLNRRLAINSWFRKTTNWKPLWLNSSAGDFSTAQALNSWGRLEEKDSSWLLTALVLRESKEKITDQRIQAIRWTGRWALLSQDSSDVFASSRLALIPFDSGSISLPLQKKPGRIIRKNVHGDELFTGWTWNNSALSIQISEDMLNNTAGFLIE